MTDLCIAIWKVKPDPSWDLETRLKKLAVAVAAAAQAEPMLDIDLGEGFPTQKPYDYTLFVAPEYYLGKTQADGSLLDKAHRQWAETRMAEIASRYSRLLLIGGSMVWTKKRLSNDLQTYAKRYQELHDRPHDDGLFGTLTEERSKALVRKSQFERVAQPAAVRLVKNTAIMAMAGENRVISSDREPDVLVGRYDKQFDFYDQGTYSEGGGLSQPRFTAEVPYRPGDKVNGEVICPLFVTGRKSPTFDWAGMQVGVEICMDHEVGALHVRGLTNLDLQVILSSTTPLKPAHSVVKVGGIVVHCDTDEEVGAWRRTATGWTALTKHNVWGEALTLRTTS